MHHLELRIPPDVTVFVFAVVMWVVARYLSLTLLIPGRLTVSIAFALLGVIVVSLGIITFRLHSTTVNPHHPERATSFVTSGIYRLSRNPMYLGLLLVLCSWAVYLANWGAVLLLPGFVMYMTRFQIRPEERVLRGKFGEEYVEYTRSVRRWV